MEKVGCIQEVVETEDESAARLSLQKRGEIFKVTPMGVATHMQAVFVTTTKSSTLLMGTTQNSVMD